jgi:hypothetical protein
MRRDPNGHIAKSYQIKTTEDQADENPGAVACWNGNCWCLARAVHSSGCNCPETSLARINSIEPSELEKRGTGCENVGKIVEFDSMDD